MKKYLLFITSSAILFFSSCVKNAKHEPAPTESFENYASAIANSPRNLKNDVLKMVDLNKKIAAKLLREGVSKEALVEAVKSRDDSKLRLASRFSDEEYVVMSKSMNDVRAAILKKYPEVQRINAKVQKCSSCDIDRQITVINSLNTQLVNGKEIITQTAFEEGFNMQEQVAAVDEEEGADCDWVPYTACLVVCAGTGPWLYWPCAYLCVRSWCK